MRPPAQPAPSAISQPAISQPAITEFAIAADDPCLDGHFPGRPLVPGAVLLAETVAALAALVGTEAALASLEGVKFRRPVAPGEVVSVRASATPKGLAFAAHVGPALALSGTASFGPPVPRG